MIKVKDLGIQEEWVYDIEVEDNHNFFANHICVHNSCYLTLEKVIERKYGKDYNDKIDKQVLIDFTLNYINKVALPLVRDKLDNVYAYTLNAYLPEKLQEDPEVICDCLPGESLISLKDGVKEIDKVNIGDYVLSYNHDKDIREYNKVTNKRKIKTSKKMLTISNSTTTLKCTEDHRIYTKNRGYIEARYIEANDDLLPL